MEGEIGFEGETIMDHRVQHKVVKSRPSFDYQVRWRGLGSDHDTWEPERNLRNASQVVQTYWDQCKAKGLRVPWSKPKCTFAVIVAQRRGRVARAIAHDAVSSAGKTGPTVSQKRRTRRHSRAARPMSQGLWTKSIRLLSYELLLCIYIYTCLLGAKDLSVGGKCKI